MDDIIIGLKTGFDALRTAVGLFKDARDLLPNDNRRVAITQALAEAEKATKSF
jgi:hypothetical protein